MMMPKTDTGSQAVTELERRKLCGEQNIRFNLEQCFLDLEYKTENDFCVNPETNERRPVPDRDRWCFYVARDSFPQKQMFYAL